MKTWEYIERTLKEHKMHFSLLDPDKKKMDLAKLKHVVESIDSYGTDLILVGGSTNVDHEYADTFIQTIKGISDKPVVIFPGGISNISKYADAILFMSMMNSIDPIWLSWMQAKAAPLIKEMNLETIAMGYVIIHPGMKVGEVGKAKLVARNDPRQAIQFSLASQYFGMKMVYLEAGSGAPEHVPAQMVAAVKEAVDIPVIVGGGIRTAEAAREITDAGADIIVTGTQIEDDPRKLKSIIDAIKS